MSGGVATKQAENLTKDCRFVPRRYCARLFLFRGEADGGMFLAQEGRRSGEDAAAATASFQRGKRANRRRRPAVALTAGLRMALMPMERMVIPRSLGNGRKPSRAL